MFFHACSDPGFRICDILPIPERLWRGGLRDMGKTCEFPCHNTKELSRCIENQLPLLSGVAVEGQFLIIYPN